MNGTPNFSRSRAVGGRAPGALAMAVLAVALSITPPPRAQAQDPAPGDERTVVPRDTAHRERRQTLFTYRDALLAGGFVGLTFAMFPLYERFARQIR